MGYFARHGVKHEGAQTVYSLRCPYCRHQGNFHSFENILDLRWIQSPPGTAEADVRLAGIRCCPNQECGGVVFLVKTVKTGQVDVFPPETIDFDASNLPEKILTSLEEAVKCHAAGCFRASALMVRRLLEELCDDRQSQGKDLKARIAGLRTYAIVPPALLEAADELRLLGNDAAHVEAREYDEIGREEVEAAIVLAKELLKAVYQYEALLSQLRGLKKPQSG